MENDLGMKYFEFVCYGNRGRSPVAELCCQNYLDSLGVRDYRAISSGVSADKVTLQMQGKRIEEKMARWSIEQGLRRTDIYDGRKRGFLEALVKLKILSDSGKENLEEFARQALTVFGKEEIRFRDQAIKELGIRGSVKISPEQTVVRPQSVLILGMSRSNTDAIRKIYEKSGLSPVIDIFEEYVGVEYTGLIQSFGSGSYEEYHDMVSKIRDYSKLAVDRFLSTPKS